MQQLNLQRSVLREMMIFVRMGRYHDQSKITVELNLPARSSLGEYKFLCFQIQHPFIWNVGPAETSFKAVQQIAIELHWRNVAGHSKNVLTDN